MLKHEKDDLKKELESQKFMNPGTGNERRRLDQIETQTATLTNQLERINLKW